MKPKRVLTEQQIAFLGYLGDEARGNIRMAMDLAGYAKTTTVKYIVDTLHEEILDVSNKLLAGSTAKAVHNLLNLLDQPGTPNAKIILEATKSVLDRAGVAKKAEDVNLKVPEGGLIILPAKQKEETTDDPTVPDVQP